MDLGEGFDFQLKKRAGLIWQYVGGAVDQCQLQLIFHVTNSEKIAPENFFELLPHIIIKHNILLFIQAVPLN